MIIEIDGYRKYILNNSKSFHKITFKYSFNTIKGLINKQVKKSFIKKEIEVIYYKERNKMTYVTLERVQYDVYSTKIKVYDENNNPLILDEFKGVKIISKDLSNDVLYESEGQIIDKFKGEVEVTPSKEMVSKDGKYPFEVKLYNDNEIITILKGDLIVTKSIQQG